MIFKQFRHLSAALALSFASVAAGSDVALVGAYEAYLAGDALKFSRQAKYLEGHLLEPWVEYWRLSMRLEDAQAADVQEFLSKHSATYVAELMRGDWLKVLGKRGDWQ